MIETSMEVKLEEPRLTADEIQRMAVGILKYRGFLTGDSWPEYTVFIEINPNLEDDCFPRFVIRMCGSEEEEQQLESLDSLLGDLHYEGSEGSLNFKLKRL